MARTGGRAVAKGTGDLREQMGRHSRRARGASVHEDWPELSLDVAPKLDMGPGAGCWVQRVNHTLEAGGGATEEGAPSKGTSGNNGEYSRSTRSSTAAPGHMRLEQLKCCQGDSGGGLSFAVHLVNVWLWPLHLPGRKRHSCSRKEAAWNPLPFLAV